METTELFPVNKVINVNAFYFNGRAPQRLKSFPKRMELDGTQYTFVESGLSYLIQKGKEVVQLFDMSDGYNTFRLRHSDGEWRLIGMRAEG